MSCHTFTTLVDRVTQTAITITPSQAQDFARAAERLGDELSLWNRFAIWAQHPQARYVADRSTWDTAWESDVAPGAEPLAIIQHDDVVHVYDVRDIRPRRACEMCQAQDGQPCEAECGNVPPLDPATAIEPDEVIALLLDIARGVAMPG